MERRPGAFEPGEIHVWRIDLSAPWDPAGEADLVATELERAARFAFDRDRHRFLHGRRALRRLLGRYAGIEPARLDLRANEHGKPLLDERLGLAFNLTHAGDAALLAVGRGAAIGIDLEEIREKPDLRALARSVFSAAEMQALRDVPDAELALPFYVTWTRKEAYLKALGSGLSIEPRSVHVGTTAARERLAGTKPGEFVEVAGLLQDARHVAAIAVVGGYSRVSFC